MWQPLTKRLHWTKSYTRKFFIHFYMFFSLFLFNMTCAPCLNHVDRYIFKATVTLANHHKAWSSWVYFPCWTDHLLSHIATVQVTLSNPEKHAQPSLPEAVDHMVDVLKKFLGKTMVIVILCLRHVIALRYYKWFKKMIRLLFLA